MVFQLGRPAVVHAERGTGSMAAPGPTGGDQIKGPLSDNCVHCCCEPRSTLSRLFGRARAVTDITKHEDFTDCLLYTSDAADDM
eukprot:7858433-Alexandrium_andersonii.AAC.1